ncbi:glycosyltransferase domain-containing protein [Alkalimonas amylolytica]|uniref:TOD1/MUCI70 glycosyltransferase-like domain-containing protein n=1 Tax=Alkalimonas amylolytica TaxID=152573 RepID=A0A1H4B8M8_ALKAM|nr:glycosyltransferase domain-containing protein [Alkalimonas amylolytica]SEA44501.1 Protein of unknown function [Alkalimonas amylolytica]
MKKNKIVVYTAIAGDYDKLLAPELIEDGVDYVCFTDNPDLTSDLWQLRPFTPKEYKFAQQDPVRLARRVKVLPHEHFPDYEYSIWMDANLTLRGSVKELINIGLETCHLATWQMPERVLCTYQQAEALIKGNYDAADVIREQMTKYRLLGFPEMNAELDQHGVMTCVLVRKHMEPELMRAMYDWWAEIALHSRRDQLSFHYIAWKNQLKYYLYDGNARDNRFFIWRRHDSRVAYLQSLGQTILQQIESRAAERAIVLWGTGSAARQTMQALPGLKVEASVDSNSAHWGKEIAGLAVYSPEQLDARLHYVVIASSYYYEISTQLCERGFSDETDFSFGISKELIGLVNFKDW